MQQTQHYCTACQRNTLHTLAESSFNHVPHLLATVLLCGSWAPVWLILSLSHRRYPDQWRCSQCGQGAGRPRLDFSPYAYGAIAIGFIFALIYGAFWLSYQPWYSNL